MAQFSLQSLSSSLSPRFVRPFLIGSPPSPFAPLAKPRFGKRYELAGPAGLCRWPSLASRGLSMAPDWPLPPGGKEGHARDQTRRSIGGAAIFSALERGHESLDETTQLLASFQRASKRRALEVIVHRLRFLGRGL